MARLLAVRGIDQGEQAKKFLTPALPISMIPIA